MQEGVGVQEVQAGKLLLADGTHQPFDECLWCTQASAPPWLTQTGLQTGFRFLDPAVHATQVYFNLNGWQQALTQACGAPKLLHPGTAKRSVA